MLVSVRHSHFWDLMDDEFGSAYARTLAHDLVMDGLGDRTADQALAAGETPRRVWEAVCASHAGSPGAPVGQSRADPEPDP